MNQGTLEAGPWTRTTARGCRKISTQFFAGARHVGSVSTRYDIRKKQVLSYAYVSIRDERGTLDSMVSNRYEDWCSPERVDEHHQWWIRVYMDNWPVVQMGADVQRYLHGGTQRPMEGASPQQQAILQALEPATPLLQAVQAWAHTSHAEPQGRLECLRQQYAVTRDLFSDAELRRLEYWRWRIALGLHKESDLVSR